MWRILAMAPPMSRGWSECRRLSRQAYWRYRFVRAPISAMAGVAPAIHVFLAAPRTWMPTTQAGMTVRYSGRFSGKRLRRYLVSRRIVAAVLIALCALSASASAQTAADFYRGKQIKFVVGTAAGQDYDLWARLIGRHITRQIPGNPALIVENM